MIITIEQVLSWHPCQAYKTEELLLAVSGGRREMELSEVLSLDVPPEDLVWLGCHALPQALRVEFACDCAERVLRVYESQYPGDRRVRDAIEITRMFNDGLVSDAELSEAIAEAAGATRAAKAAWAAKAAEVAAWAAEAAAAAAAWVAEAAAGAAWAAAEAAAWAAAWAAGTAKATEENWHLERLRYYASLV